MCGWCCGGTPVQKRGEGHKGCSETCYNTPPTRYEPVECDLAGDREEEKDEWREKALRYEKMLYDLGFCPQDKESMPCAVCGDGL